MLLTGAWVLTAPGVRRDESSIRVVVAEDQQARDQFAPGDPLSGGTVTLAHQDNVISEYSLDREGRATISGLVGSYTLQVSMESNDPVCFWGNTLYDLNSPEAELEIAVFQVCSGL
jgi:hypothetical protein